MRMVALYWVNYGPYHVARGRAVRALFSSRGVQVRFVEGASVERAYPWTRADDGLPIETLFPGQTYETVRAGRLRHALTTWLAKNQPDGVAVPGYGVEGRAVARWARQEAKVAVLMSESTYDDFPRWRIREWVKSLIVTAFDAALVGGTPQGDYLAGLGMPSHRIFVGYSVVDNDYFARRSQQEAHKGEARRRELGLPAKYFLLVSRFIMVKNIPKFLEAYSRYRTVARRRAWAVVICGSGPLDQAIRQAIGRLAIEPHAYLPGFKNYEELPAYYGFASCLVLPSVRDTWGLVVNEAMACGLPVLVSQRCGCCGDLVRDGVNGFTFDPRDREGMAERLLQVSLGGVDLRGMGAASERIIEPWSPRRFAENLWQAFDAGREAAAVRSRSSWMDPALWV